MEIKFKLLKPLGNYKKGKVFECFGGLVSGVDGIPFLDQNYFSIVKSHTKKDPQKRSKNTI